MMRRYTSRDAALARFCGIAWGLLAILHPAGAVLAQPEGADDEGLSATKVIGACERLIEGYQVNVPPNYDGKPQTVTVDNPLVGQTLELRGEVLEVNPAARTLALGLTSRFRMEYSTTNEERKRLEALKATVDRTRADYERFVDSTSARRAKTKFKDPSADEKYLDESQRKRHLDTMEKARKAYGDYLRSLKERTKAAQHRLQVYVGDVDVQAQRGTRIRLPVAVQSMSWNNNALVPTMNIVGRHVDAEFAAPEPVEREPEQFVALGDVLTQCDSVLVDFARVDPNETTLAQQNRHRDVMARVNKMLKDREVAFNAQVVDVRRRAGAQDALQYELAATLYDPRRSGDQPVTCLFDDYVEGLAEVRRAHVVPLRGRIVSADVAGYEDGEAPKYSLTIRVISSEGAADLEFFGTVANE